MTEEPVLIRPAQQTDLPAIAEIYRWNVLHGTGTFELEPPDLADMTHRWEDVRAKGLPWLVAQCGSVLSGYAYANHFRPRRAYRFCLENSIYLASDMRGRGLGRLLLAELMARCTAAGARQLLAVIGDSDNLASVALHRSMGFESIGIMKSAGWKFERWLDVVLMQRSLGDGDSSAPEDALA